MTDLEITKLCAEAMGLTLGQSEGCGKYSTGVMCYAEGAYILYDPLHDDAQAMVLVKRQGLHIVWQPMCPDTWKVDDTTHVAADKDLNRAICECVAKMQAAK